MNEQVKTLFNGNAAIFYRVGSLIIQGVIVAGMFWIGGTFERKEDFEKYKSEQEIRRMEEFKAMSQITETMARLDERMKLDKK